MFRGRLDLRVFLAFLGVLCLSLSDVGAFNWITFGDWGEPTAILAVVSRAMGEVASKLKPKFLVSVGDNFYRWGVSSVDDPLWDHMFENVFTHEALRDVQFRCVLGNHDWWGNATAQVDRHYSLKSPRWYMPNFWFYTIEEFDAPRYAPHPYLSVNNGHKDESKAEMVKTKAIFIYTDSWLMSYRMGTDVNSRIWNEQMKFIEDTLKAAIVRDIDWIFVIGHYPCYSSGEHGDNADINRILNPILKKYKVDAYIAGHDHHLELSRPKGSCTSHLLIGSACCPKKHNYFNNKHRIFRTGRGGFASHKLTHTQFHTTYHNIEGRPIFTTTQKRVSRKGIKEKLIREALAKAKLHVPNKQSVLSDGEELELLDGIEAEKEDILVERVQDELDTEMENAGIAVSGRNLENNTGLSSIHNYKTDDEKVRVFLPPIYDSAREISLVDAIISDLRNNDDYYVPKASKQIEHVLQVYELPPPSKRTFIDEIPTRDKYYGIRFPFGARLMRFSIDRKTVGHPRHEYRYAPKLTHSVGVEGSEVTKYSVFQKIAWNMISDIIKKNYMIPEATWRLMRNKEWKGNFVPWRFVESCTNILRTMSDNGLLKHRHSFLGIPLTTFKNSKKDMGFKKALKYCKKAADSLNIHKLLQGPTVSQKLMYWDKCPGDQMNNQENEVNSALKTIVALAAIGTARDHCLYSETQVPTIERSSAGKISSKIKRFFRKLKLVPKESVDPDFIGGIDLNRIILIPLDTACEIATQLINHEMNIVSGLKDLVYDRPDEAINSCAQIVHLVATFIPFTEAQKLCANFKSYELSGP
ncbi:secreted acid phosphatase [Cryptosporidium ryanae]|uniref:secreted acid phosphatase n=1 Tax=Cryptosporidium ryanae TaxID=515981 RepID=UPI00351A5187|nr:secreted acid phosphatase [Cryptosporidium ryanae]